MLHCSKGMNTKQVIWNISQRKWCKSVIFQERICLFACFLIFLGSINQDKKTKKKKKKKKKKGSKEEKGLIEIFYIDIHFTLERYS